jgi:hypothetical protein
LNLPTGQLDLFLHSGPVILINDAIDALLARDAPRAAACLDRLRAEEPGHCAVEALERLCRTLREWPLPSTNAAEIATAVHHLETGVHPAALAAMGSQAPDFMRPFWRDLAHAAGTHRYDADYPQSYCAGLLLRCGDARSAATAVEWIPNRDHNADALQWLALARYRNDGLEACRSVLMRLALVAPQRLKGTLAEINDELLDRDWQDFHMACSWLDANDDHAGMWFPAWYLVEHPGARIAPADARSLPPTRSARTFIAVAHLLELEKRGYSKALISARSRLRDLHPEIFAFYIARRRTSHA